MKKLLTLMNCWGSSRLDEHRITSLFNLVVNLWQTRSWRECNVRFSVFTYKNYPFEKRGKNCHHILTSDLVAPPIIKTKIRRPIFLKSLDACLRMEWSLHRGEKGLRLWVTSVYTCNALFLNKTIATMILTLNSHLQNLEAGPTLVCV